ncbi:hypothetical protein B0H16DRAFT_1776024 [Mycena metata]|uniref:Uncharacterized protein n=1 Tax=Mycena metata TaxID=1033252 RepID=A0AAD7HXG0_9AGAR|nr:hypothetical protein B0H16DRAFT_1776024 [Mycena metata]
MLRCSTCSAHGLGRWLRGSSSALRYWTPPPCASPSIHNTWTTATSSTRHLYPTLHIYILRTTLSLALDFAPAFASPDAPNINPLRTTTHRPSPSTFRTYLVARGPTTSLLFTFTSSRRHRSLKIHRHHRTRLKQLPALPIHLPFLPLPFPPLPHSLHSQTTQHPIPATAAAIPTTAVYTFLATLILLLAVSAAIVVRSLLLRRRHRRMVAEAIANGTWVAPGELLFSFSLL